MFQACHILSSTSASYAIIFSDNFYSALEIVLYLLYGKNVIGAFKLNEKIVTFLICLSQAMIGLEKSKCRIPCHIEPLLKKGEYAVHSEWYTQERKLSFFSCWLALSNATTH